MQTDHSRLQYLVRQYADNLSTREEMSELFSIIAESEHDVELNQEFLTIWNSIHPHQQVLSIDKNHLFSEIERNISVLPVRQTRFMWARAAAILALVLGAGVIYFYLNGSAEKKSEPVVAANQLTRSSHSLVKLPDGSSVLLNDNSTLDYSTFTETNRQVVLSGEAYFDIKRDKAHPFAIRTGKLKTTVLGTSFNIRAYPQENDVTVTVTRGKVEVEMENKTLGIITPNQQISFNKQYGSTVQQQVLADSILIWKQNDLVFDNTNFEEAAVILSNRFNVSVSFSNEHLKKCRFTASFLNENNIHQVLTVLCDVNNATYEMKNDSIIIKGEGCK
ncbi:MAG: FecR domain-containing protein [Chitinophagaceae bacterium]|nr:FecR domain-containing protein [Chitinophagaceae bacterium]